MQNDGRCPDAARVTTARRRVAARPLAIAILVVQLALAACGDGEGAVESPQDPVERANDLLAQMTHDEKIALVANGGAGISRLHIPAIVASDGPNGVRLGGPHKTAFPSAELVASSWDRALAGRFGEALGAEAAGMGFNLLLGPTVNILRTPKWGRAAETFSEDPYLAGQIAAAEIQGIQREHVMAEVKHFVANNQEINRWGNPLGLPPLSPAVNVVVSERALQEIYFPAFKAAVQIGGVASVMCAYPRVNGMYACQNPDILDTLKSAWGFSGFVEPDATLAVRDTLAAIQAGTDQFQLGTLITTPEQALPQVSSDRLDDMVRRVLTAMFSVGLFDYPNNGKPDAVVSTPAHLTLSAEIGAQGSVLLKNDNHILPLTGDVRSVAVVGYDAGPGTQTILGGAAAVIGGPVVTPLDAIKARAGQSVTVTYAPGTLGVVPLPIVPADVLTPSSGSGSGLLGTYYVKSDWSGTSHTAASPTLDMVKVLAGNDRSARWTGTLTPPVTGTYRFSLAYAGIVRLFIDGALVASGDTEGLDNPAFTETPGAPQDTAQGLANLTAGTPVPITVEYSIGSASGGSDLHFGWQIPDPTLSADAVAAASASDVAVVFVNDVTCEGMDRSSLALPGDQDDLIAKVAAANPHTIVVLHTSGPVLMPWLSQVAAVIQSWYPGQESGDAIAAVLFGDTEPSGRLPMTFPAREDQGPGQTPTEYPGVAGTVSYDEDIYVGYRYYDQNGQEPLFPFGYGLSYTTFSLDALQVSGRSGGGYDVLVTVTNTGSRKGAAVVQLYVGFPTSAEEPPRQLRGFAKVMLNPGQRQVVDMALDGASFATWSTTEHAFVVHPGTYQIQVGTSSRDLPLQTTLVLP